MRVVRTYLEMRAPEALRAAAAPDDPLGVRRVDPPDIATFRRLYREVGAAYRWHDREAIADDALRAHFASPGVALWVLSDTAGDLGFFELARDAAGAVEIAYFGLVPRAMGRGLGKHLLTRAVRAAWAMGASRVWLHTCTLDAPTALPNYLARGFDPYAVETYEVPDASAATHA